MNTEARKRAAAKKLAARRGISESSALLEVDTMGLNAALSLLGESSSGSSSGSSSYDSSSSYSSSYDSGSSYSGE